jgi:hypothetical protein
MKKLILIVNLFFAINCFSQNTITSQQAQENIGKEVILVGKIASFKLASEGRNTNYLNIDKAFPNNVFTVVLTNRFIEEHKIDTSNLMGKEITVQGVVTVYEKDPKKIPQIFNPSTIVIK